MCIAADSGIDHAKRLGLTPDVVVGDLDSVSVEGLAWVTDLGVPIHRYPTDKDQTDLEIALDTAVGSGHPRILVIALGGGRLDHLLANYSVLGDRRYAAAHVDALDGTALVSVVHDQRTLEGRSGELVSLVAINGDATMVTTTGLQYPLEGETLPAGASRGVSNVFSGTHATVQIGGGTLLAVQPERLQPSDGSQDDLHDPAGGGLTHGGQ